MKRGIEFYDRYTDYDDSEYRHPPVRAETNYDGYDGDGFRRIDPEDANADMLPIDER